MERENALIRVYDGGKYIQLGFYSDDQKRIIYSYYETTGDSYKKIGSINTYSSDSVS